MRYFRPYWIVALSSALLLAGCRLPGSDGPVSKSLATCRQLSQRGIAAAERGQQQQAEALLAEAVQACPLDPEARYHYAEMLWRRGAGQEAIAQLEEAGQLAPEDAMLRVRLAEMYLAVGQLAASRQNAERALDLDPKLSAAWATRARILLAGGQRRQALADYLRALGYAPDDQQILLEVAELYRQLNQPQRALGTLQNLADTYSPGEEPQRVLYLTGVAYAALGRYQDAVESLSAAALRQNPNPEVFYALAKVELLAGHPDRAAAAARQVLALAPQHRASQELLGRIEMAQQPQSFPRR
jgi:tetratricopeptide (TPR) repeat protein